MYNYEVSHSVRSTTTKEATWREDNNDKSSSRKSCFTEFRVVPKRNVRLLCGPDESCKWKQVSVLLEWPGRVSQSFERSGRIRCYILSRV